MQLQAGPRKRLPTTSTSAALYDLYLTYILNFQVRSMYQSMYQSVLRSKTGLINWSDLAADGSGKASLLDQTE